MSHLRYGFLLAVSMAGSASAQSNVSNQVAVADNKPDLITAYRQARENSAQYQAAHAAFRAEAQSKSLARAELLPRLKGQAGYDYVDQSVEGSFFGVDDIDESESFNSYDFGVVLTQPLYHRDAFIGLKEADVKMEKAKLQMITLDDELRVNVARAYFHLLAAQDSMELAKKEKETIEKQRDQTLNRFESGLAPEANYKLAQAQYDLADSAEIGAQSEVALSQSQLESLSGESYDTVAGLADNLNLTPPQPNAMQPWVDQAVQNNAKVLTQAAEARLAQLRTDKIQSQRWPTLDLVGSYVYVDQDGGFFDQAGGLGGENKDQDARIGVQLNVPFYNGGQISARVRQAEELHSRELALAKQQRSEITGETRAAFLRVQKALAQIRALSQAVESAKSAEEAAQVGFDVGTSTSAEALSAVRDRFRTEGNLATARYDYLIGSLELKKAAGSLTDEDLAKINRYLR